MNIQFKRINILGVRSNAEHKCDFARQSVAVIISVILLILGLTFTFLGANLLSKQNEIVGCPEVFVGVDIGYGNETDVYKTVDAVAGYANLIIIGSLDVTEDTAALIRVCDYLYDKGFYMMVYVGYAEEGHYPPRGPDPYFFNSTAKQWGEKFLGAYLFDEAGGQQIDQNHPLFEHADNYTHANQLYIDGLSKALTRYTEYYGSSDLQLFTSDYALYWYDYLSGYDVVLAQYVGNQSRHITNSLCRGASHSLNKDWGVIITWKYNQAPFLEEADQLYEDMVLAYENQAKYIIVFNSAENNTHPTNLGTLTEDHLQAMKQFWNYTKTNPQSETYVSNVAYVLPDDYGYGFRSANDKTWGLWEADVLSAQVWGDTNSLLQTYGSKLDIIYESVAKNQSVNLPYNKLVFWNGTINQR